MMERVHDDAADDDDYVEGKAWKARKTSPSTRGSSFSDLDAREQSTAKGGVAYAIFCATLSTSFAFAFDGYMPARSESEACHGTKSSFELGIRDTESLRYVKTNRIKPPFYIPLTLYMCIYHTSSSKLISSYWKFVLFIHLRRAVVSGIFFLLFISLSIEFAVSGIYFKLLHESKPPKNQPCLASVALTSLTHSFSHTTHPTTHPPKSSEPC